MSAVLALLAVLLDAWLGEPRRWHPLVSFGRLAETLEQALNRGRWRRARGVLGLVLMVIPFTLLAWWSQALPIIGGISLSWLVDVWALYFALGLRSLHEHARPVLAALSSRDREAAQAQAARMVSRDSSALDPAAATTESVLENGNDGVFAALFWFLVAGAPGAIAFRLVNTLDAMWGYRTERFHAYGWAAARLDDLVSWLPARLTALSYAALGQTVLALRCWRTQARQWDSPNAGPVMAAGAGALGIELGGPARYQGEWHQRPVLGAGPAAQGADIERALQLVRRAVGLWLALALIGALIMAALRSV